MNLCYGRILSTSTTNLKLQNDCYTIMTPTQNTTHLDKYETILFQKSMNVNVLFSIDEFAEIYQGALLVPEGVVGNCCHSISFWNCIHAIPCNGTLLFQCNLPRVLPVTIYKYASCLISYIVSFLILCGEWSSLVFQHFKIYLHEVS